MIAPSFHERAVAALGAVVSTVILVAMEHPEKLFSFPAVSTETLK